MRAIEYATSFKRDYKRQTKGRYRLSLDRDLTLVLNHLVMDQPLESKYCDHDLNGNLAGYRECHIKPNLLLIYQKSNTDTLRLARLGSHSDLFG